MLCRFPRRYAENLWTELSTGILQIQSGINTAAKYQPEHWDGVPVYMHKVSSSWEYTPRNFDD